MQTEYDDNVLDYWRLPNGNHIEKIIKDEGLHGDKGKKKYNALTLGANF